MFAFIFQITIYARTNEHSERGSYGSTVRERCKDSRWLKKNKRETAHSGVDCLGDGRQNVIISGRFKWAANLENDTFGFFFLIQQVVSKSASEHEINKWLAPACFFDLFLMALMWAWKWRDYMYTRVDGGAVE